MSVAANRYAKALIDALPPEKAEQGYQQLDRFKGLLDEQPETRLFFENPTVPAERRNSLIGEIGDAFGFSREIRNFIAIVVERNRISLFDEILQRYRKAMDDRLGIVRATVTTAHPLDNSQRADLAERLATLTGKDVRMEVSVDPSLIGGVVAKVGSTIYDGSLRQQLRAFKARVVHE